MQESRQQERRRSRRIRIGQPLMVRPSDPQDAYFEETAITRNVSREGIYFFSKNEIYRAGMRLFISLPSPSPSEPQDHEYIGQVARIEKLPDGSRGIAVQLLTSVSTHSAHSSTALKHTY